MIINKNHYVPVELITSEAIHNAIVAAFVAAGFKTAADCGQWCNLAGYKSCKIIWTAINHSTECKPLTLQQLFTAENGLKWPVWATSLACKKNGSVIFMGDGIFCAAVPNNPLGNVRNLLDNLADYQILATRATAQDNNRVAPWLVEQPHDATRYSPVSQYYYKQIGDDWYFWYDTGWLRSSDNDNIDVLELQPLSTGAPQLSMPDNAFTTRLLITTTPEQGSDWANDHYNSNYQLAPKDIENGYVKIDPYFVSEQWELGSRDNTGVLFHQLKTIARFGDKHNIEREIKALYNQAKRLAEIHGVDL